MATTAVRLTLSNRLENRRLLLDFIRNWAQDRRVSGPQRHNLELAAGEIFQHLVRHAYQPEQPGSIAVSVEEKGPRLRLMFEDDAPPHNPRSLETLPLPAANAAARQPPDALQQLVESLIYYRTGDHKNRLVLFLT